MREIHLYDLHNWKAVEDVTGQRLTPPELMEADLPKEAFAVAPERLEGYGGEWFIEVRREKKYSGDASPFDLEYGFSGPYGHFFRPAKVYLILKDAE